MTKKNITRSEVSLANQLTEKVLNDHKKKVGDVILVEINKRTTIELSANLSKEEKEARIEMYKRLHKY